MLSFCNVYVSNESGVMLSRTGGKRRKKTTEGGEKKRGKGDCRCFRRQPPVVTCPKQLFSDKGTVAHTGGGKKRKRKKRVKGRGTQ